MANRNIKKLPIYSQTEVTLFLFKTVLLWYVRCEIYSANCSVDLPDAGWNSVAGKTADLDLIYRKIYADGNLKFEIETFNDDGECEILYCR